MKDQQLCFRRSFPFYAKIATLVLLPMLSLVYFQAISRTSSQIGNTKEKTQQKPSSPIYEDAGGEKRIHFIESSGEGCLRPRQACSVESAAISNPDMRIYLHMAENPPPGKPELLNGEGLDRHCITMELLQSFPNVEILREDLVSILNDTLLESLTPELNRSLHANEHLTDAVRIALLYKYGGIYSDIDTLIFKPLRGLRNTAGHVLVHDQSFIENGFLIVDRKSDFLIYMMRVMLEEYRTASEERLVMGPSALTRAFREYCFHSPPTINPSISKYTCEKGHNLTLLNNSAFYPITYGEKSIFFNSKFTYSDLARLKESYSAHIYDSIHGVHVPETSLYAYLAKKYCPISYGYHEKGIYVF